MSGLQVTQTREALLWLSNQGKIHSIPCQREYNREKQATIEYS